MTMNGDRPFLGKGWRFPWGTQSGVDGRGAVALCSDDYSGCRLPIDKHIAAQGAINSATEKIILESDQGIELKTGSSAIKIEQSGNIEIDASSGQVNVKGSQINLN